MSGKAIQRFAFCFFALTIAFVAALAYRDSLLRHQRVEDVAFTKGFGEHFSGLVGHGPETRWGDCWMAGVQVAVDTTTFAFICPGETTIDLDLSLAPPELWGGCPYLFVAPAESDARFEDLAARLCPQLPVHGTGKQCCSTSRRESPRALEPVSSRQPASPRAN